MPSVTDTQEQAASSIDQFDAEAVNSKEKRVLYEARKKIFPKRASGSFRKLKWWIMAVTLGIYYLTPWIRWDRGAFAPDQAVLVDMANRRFYFFFIEIWPQEFFFVAGLLVMAGIGLFLVTSTVGRAWCGYTCPQTVWVDLFLVVERFFEGDRNARIKLDQQSYDANKIVRRVAKHITWLLIAVATGGAWIFYFADAPTLFIDVFTGQAAFVAYATIGVLTATTYIFGGLMREQVCTYMCPWPRIQAAMLDENSLTVTYNDWRGEPRSRHAKKLKKQGVVTGDCVDCNACVAVCPMGIDIRDGQQLECITCALCIDACDGVMSKLGLEKGLISYSTLSDYNNNMALATGGSVGTGTSSAIVGAEIDPALIRKPDGRLVDAIKHFDWRTLIRVRTLIYTGIYAAIGLALLLALVTRDRLDLNIIRDRNPLFVTLSDGSVRNGYEVKILNMIAEPRSFVLRMDGLPGATIRLSGADQDQSGPITLAVEPDQLRSIRLFVTRPLETITESRTSFTFVVDEVGGEESASYETTFDAPDK